MSDFPQTTEEQAARRASPPVPVKETSPARLIVLLLVFGVALAGLLYDYTIARPAIKKANQTILGLIDGSIKDPGNDGVVTADEVQSLFGRAPSSVEQQDNGKIELYRWRSGLPWRTYDLYVVYSGRQMPLLHSVTIGVEPDERDLPEKTAMPKQLTDEDVKNFKPRRPSGAGGPGAGPAGNASRGDDDRTPPADASADSGEPAAGAEPDTQPPADAPKADELLPATDPAPPEPAPTAEPASAEPATQEPAPSAEPAKQEPASPEPASPEPASPEPAPPSEPAPQEPAPPAEPGK